MGRAVLGFVCAFVLATIIAACGGGAADDAAERELRVGYSFGFDTGDVGDRFAFQELERRSGIRASFQETGGGTNAVVALDRGDIDIANMIIPDVLKAVSQGADLRIILVANEVAEFVLVAQSGIERIEDLEGKTVAYNGPDDLTGALTALLLGRADVEDRVELVPLDDSINRATALLAGRIDAAVIEFVEYMRIEYEQPGFEILGSMKDTSPFPVNTVFVVTAEFAEQNQELLGQVVSGLLEGYEILYLPEGRQRWTELAGATQLEGEDPAVVASVYDFYRDLGFWPRRATPVSQVDYERGVDFWLENGQIEVPVAFADVWELAAWEEAAGGGG